MHDKKSAEGRDDDESRYSHRPCGGDEGEVLLRCVELSMLSEPVLFVFLLKQQDFAIGGANQLGWRELTKTPFSLK